MDEKMFTQRPVESGQEDGEKPEVLDMQINDLDTVYQASLEQNEKDRIDFDKKQKREVMGAYENVTKALENMYREPPSEMSTILSELVSSLSQEVPDHYNIGRLINSLSRTMYDEQSELKRKVQQMKSVLDVETQEVVSSSEMTPVEPMPTVVAGQVEVVAVEPTKKGGVFGRILGILGGRKQAETTNKVITQPQATVPLESPESPTPRETEADRLRAHIKESEAQIEQITRALGAVEEVQTLQSKSDSAQYDFTERLGKRERAYEKEYYENRKRLLMKRYGNTPERVQERREFQEVVDTLAQQGRKDVLELLLSQKGVEESALKTIPGEEAYQYLCNRIEEIRAQNRNVSQDVLQNLIESELSQTVRNTEVYGGLHNLLRCAYLFERYFPEQQAESTGLEKLRDVLSERKNHFLGVLQNTRVSFREPRPLFSLASTRDEDGEIPTHYKDQTDILAGIPEIKRKVELQNARVTPPPEEGVVVDYFQGNPLVLNRTTSGQSPEYVTYSPADWRT